MPSKHSLYEALERSMNIIGAQMHVCIPGRIERYDHTQQRADVVPLLSDKYADGQVADPQVITNVPVVFPRSGGASLTMPVNRGDGVMLHFADRSLDEWLGSGGTVTPSDPRAHDLSDCIAVPGLYSFADASPQDNNTDTVLQYSGAEMRMKPGGALEITTSASVTVNTGSATVNASDTTINSETTNNGNVSINGNLTVSGATTTSGLVSDGISFDTHVHGNVASGNSTTGTPE